MSLSRTLAAFALIASAGAAQIRVAPLLELEGETSEPNISPDGKTLAFDWCKPDYSCGIYTRPFAGGEVRLLTGRDSKDGLPVFPRWSPDGKRIAFARYYSHFDNHLFVRDVDRGGERDLGLICDRALESSWSADGHFLVASVYAEDPPRTFGCRLALFSSDTGMRVREITPRGGASALSAGGRMLAYADGTALMLLKLTPDYRPAGAAATVAREPREISSVYWTQDGKQILYQVWGDVHYLRRVALGAGARPEAIPNPASELDIVQLLADGSTLATETTRIEALWRADLTSTPPKLDTVSDPGCSSGAPGCSPDGRLSAFITVRTGISQIWLANGDGTSERPLVKSIPAFSGPTDDGVASLVGWSPDGKWIAFSVFPRGGNADVRSHLYIVPPSGGTPRRLGKEAYALDTPTWSRDGKSLYAAQGWAIDDRTHDFKSPIVRVDVTDGKLTPLGADGMWPRVSRDGKFVYFFTQPRPKLSRIPDGGGAAELLYDKDDLLWYSIGVGERYLYLFQKPPRDAIGQAHNIIRFDPELRQATVLASVPFRPQSAFLSPDGRSLYFEQRENPKRRVVLVQGLF
jgi:Tol biopolymer transport system component